MVNRPRPLVAGNWKMNGLLQASTRLLDEIRDGYAPELRARVDLLVAPPATLLHPIAERARGSGVAIGGQDCHAQAKGAFTGDLSAGMLADLGASHVIVGHSERRHGHGETDADVRAKAQAAQHAGLTPIVCVGETRAEREAGEALAVVRRQLQGSLAEQGSGAAPIVAYEPVWAIGTGLTPTGDDVAEVHALIRAELADILGPAERHQVRILYGGSVKPDNARALMAIDDVDGALVGGASLVSAEFLAIAAACAAR